MTPPELSHDEIEELVAADALSGLSELEGQRLRREMAEHGPDCPECARLLADYAGVAGELPLVAEPMALSPGAGSRLLERIHTDERTDGHRVGTLASRRDADRPPSDGVRVERGAARTRRWLATAAVAAAVAVVAGAIGYVLAPRGGSAVRVATFATAPGRSLAVAYTPGSAEARIVGANVPPPPAGRVYELWYRPPGSTVMRPAGTFAPRSAGVVDAAVHVGASFDALAVSVEPRGGSPHPTTAPIYLVRVPAS